MPENHIKQVQDAYVAELKRAFPHFWSEVSKSPEFVKGATGWDDFIREFLASDTWLTPEGSKLEDEVSQLMMGDPEAHKLWDSSLREFTNWVKENFEIPQTPAQEVEEWTKSSNPLALYEQSLMTGDFDKAREIHKKMDPELKELADDIAQRVFASSMRGLSHALVQRGHLGEARQLMAMYLKIPVFEKKPG